MALLHVTPHPEAVAPDVDDVAPVEDSVEEGRRHHLGGTGGAAVEESGRHHLVV